MYIYIPPGFPSKCKMLSSLSHPVTSSNGKSPLKGTSTKVETQHPTRSGKQRYNKMRHRSGTPIKCWISLVIFPHGGFLN